MRADGGADAAEEEAGAAGELENAGVVVGWGVVGEEAVEEGEERERGGDVPGEFVGGGDGVVEVGAGGGGVGWGWAVGVVGHGCGGWLRVVIAEGWVWGCREEGRCS